VRPSERGNPSARSRSEIYHGGVTRTPGRAVTIVSRPRAERTLTIVNQRGLHARAAAKFV